MVEYEPAEDLRVKGKREPLKVWSARAARPADTDPRSPHATPLVGRDSQLDAVWSALARVREHRSPQLVTVVGVPGIGKSRLVFELLRRVEQDGEPITLVERQVASLRRGRHLLGVGRGRAVGGRHSPLRRDGPCGRQAARGRRLAGSPTPGKLPGWKPSCVHCWASSSAASRPRTGRSRRSPPGGGSWNRWPRSTRWCWCSRTCTGPTTRCSTSSHQLVEWMSAVPVLVLCTARPELLDRRPGWGGGTDALTISLPPLSERDTAMLIAALLDQVALPAETADGAAEPRRGKPVVRAGVRADAARPRLPGATRATLVAGRERRAAAAGVGARHHRGAAGRAGSRGQGPGAGRCGDRQGGVGGGGGARWPGGGAGRWSSSSTASSNASFCGVEPESSVDGETQYSFQHALIRDVAYAQVVQVCQSREAHPRGRLDRVAGRRAGRLDRAARPSLPDSARPVYRRRIEHGRAARPGSRCAARGGRPRPRPERVRGGRALLRLGVHPVPGGHRRPAAAAVPIRPGAHVQRGRAAAGSGAGRPRAGRGRRPRVGRRGRERDRHMARPARRQGHRACAPHARGRPARARVDVAGQGGSAVVAGKRVRAAGAAGRRDPDGRGCGGDRIRAGTGRPARVESPDARAGVAAAAGRAGDRRVRASRHDRAHARVLRRRDDRAQLWNLSAGAG